MKIEFCVLAETHWNSKKLFEFKLLKLAKTQSKSDLSLDTKLNEINFWIKTVIIIKDTIGINFKFFQLQNSQKYNKNQKPTTSMEEKNCH